MIRLHFSTGRFSLPVSALLNHFPVRFVQTISTSSFNKSKKGSTKDSSQSGNVKTLARTLNAKFDASDNPSINTGRDDGKLPENEPSKMNMNNLKSTTGSSSLAKIYTRTGDGGTSVLLSSGARRLPKDSLVFDVLGTLDELSSVIGIVLSTCSFPSIRSQLENIQFYLFEVGSCVAANNTSSRFTFNDVKLVQQLEQQIDQMTSELPELRNFILPGGGSPTASHVHLARAICRRCERLMTKWNNQSREENVDQQETVMGIYLNRLSDYLFTLARYITHKEGHREITYHKRT